jgi:ABC-2 type transport system permease protein
VARAPSGGGSNLTGWWTLTRFILRRDRVRLAVWAASIFAVYAYFVAALGAMGAEALAARGLVMETPAGIVMGGPGYGVENYTIGIAMANEMITWVTLALAIMAIMHVVRHTRAEEESSRSELVRAGVVGRHAPAVAAFVSLVMVQVVIALASGFAINAVGGQDMPLVDSLGMTFGVAAAVLAYGAFATIACQLTEHSRGATGLGIAFFGLTFVLRVVGDLQERGGSLASWFSPLGWAQQMRPFYDLRWWPILLSLGLTAILLVIGALLASHRDFGAGMWAARRGRADASPGLRSPWALAWRQMRTAFMWTTIGLGLMWYATGTMLPDIMDMGLDAMTDNPIFAEVFGGAGPEGFRDGFLNIMVIFVALCAVAFGIAFVARARTEETEGRTELMLATPVSRSRWLWAQLGMAGLLSLALLALSIYAIWAGAGSVGETEPGIGVYTQTFLTYVPALAVYLGVPAVLFAWSPRLVGWGWLLIAWTFVFGIFGPVFNAPELTSWIDPLHWTPASFGGDIPVGGTVGLIVAALALWVLAFVGFRRRDVPAV